MNTLLSLFYSLSEMAQRNSTELRHLFSPFCNDDNRYLTGFTLFLSLILNRTFVLILDLLKSEERMEVIKKQAAQQSKEYERVSESEKNLQKELKDLNEIVSSHSSVAKDLENLKKQANQQQKEYLRMADENNAMEKKLKGGKSESRKDI